jgi:hypothetical protein
VYQVSAYVQQGRKRGSVCQTTGDAGAALEFYSACVARPDCVSICFIGPDGKGETSIRRAGRWSVYPSDRVVDEVTP